MCETLHAAPGAVRVGRSVPGRAPHLSGGPAGADEGQGDGRGAAEGDRGPRDWGGRGLRSESTLMFRLPVTLERISVARLGPNVLMKSEGPYATPLP